MDLRLKQTALSNLARIDGETAQAAIEKELSKIAASLETETQYDRIAEQLALLDVIAYRVHEEAVELIKNLLIRLSGLELTYHENDYLSEYRNKYSLMVKALEILEHIRYHQPSAILDIFFEYSCHEEEEVKKQAVHGLEAIAGYDLDIFYGDGKDWPGLGWKPQEKIIEKIASFDEGQRKLYFSAIITVCSKMLSPTVEGTQWTYNTVTWRTGTVTADDGMKKIRQNTLKIIKELYSLADNVEQQKSVLNAMNSATRTPHSSKLRDDVLAMIIADTVAVLEFMRDIVNSDSDMQVLQKIEHDTYWLLYHKGELSADIKRLSLEIRDLLYNNAEYKIFRILIGFESIFHNWEKGGVENRNFEQEEKVRKSEMLKLAEEINDSTYDKWKGRIVQYASIKSSDMATFPYFRKFLEHFGETSPKLALRLLSESSEQLENFMVAILCGIAETEEKENVYSLIEGWCDEGKYLSTLASFFEFSSEVNEGLLKKIMDKAKDTNDLPTLNQIIASVSAQYKDGSEDLIEEFFIPIIQILTKHKNSGWIFGFWFRKQRGDILSSMTIDEHKVILGNLLYLNEVDYHAEEILSEIAKRSPELVIEFFCKRLSMEKDDDSEYQAIPFEFHTLSGSLSTIPDKAVDIVRNIYNGDYGLFIYTGARLLKNIFTDFSESFQNKLLQVIQSKKEDDLLFVMAILRNYDGNPIIHNVCKEIIKLLPDDDKLVSKVSVILESTGVVSGEYGFVKAYEQKIAEIKPWLNDSDNKVKTFAQTYTDNLQKRIEYEKKRKDEEIILRKYQYGDSEY